MKFPVSFPLPTRNTKLPCTDTARCAALRTWKALSTSTTKYFVLPGVYYRISHTAATLCLGARPGSCVHLFHHHAQSRRLPSRPYPTYQLTPPSFPHRSRFPSPVARPNFHPLSPAPRPATLLPVLMLLSLGGPSNLPSCLALAHATALLSTSSARPPNYSIILRDSVRVDSVCLDSRDDNPRAGAAQRHPLVGQACNDARRSTPRRCSRPY